MKIGHRLKKLREEMGVTQEFVATALNVARPMVSNWERDDAHPNYVNLVQLSELFGVSTDYILTGYQPMDKGLKPDRPTAPRPGKIIGSDDPVKDRDLSTIMHKLKTLPEQDQVIVDTLINQLLARQVGTSKRNRQANAG